MGQANDSIAARRIREVLDENSFVELGAWVTARNTDFNLTAEKTPSDGVVTGYGTIDGKLVYLYSQDPRVLGGSVGEMHAKKIGRIYEMAMKMGAPVIGLIDCAGLRLEEAGDALNAFGELYRCQAEANGVVPQIQAIYGGCGGSMAVSAAMADFTFMETAEGRLFLHVPNALSGSGASTADTASAVFQSEESGIADFVGTAEEIAEGIRSLVRLLPASFEDDLSYESCEDSLNRLVPEIAALDQSERLAAISDDGFVIEPGKGFGASVTTAFIRLNGCTVGAVAVASDAVCWRGVEKASRFVRFCDAFQIPILTLAEASGFRKDLSSERHLAKKAASLIFAYASATVPKVTLFTGETYGLAYNLFAPKTVSDVVLAWPAAKLSLMEAGDAVKIMYAKELENTENKADFYQEKVDAYTALQSDVKSAARRGYVDDIIDAQLTRKRVIAAFEMLFTKSESISVRKHGTI